MSKEYNPLSLKTSQFEVTDSNHVVAKNEDLYEDHLPKGITVDMLDKVDAYNQDFIASVKSSAGKLAIEEMANNDDISSLTISVPMHNADVSSVLNRRTAMEVDGKEELVYGSNVTTVTTRLGDAENSPIKASDSYLAQLARDNFEEE